MSALEELGELLGVPITMVERDKQPGLVWSLELGRLVPDEDYFTAEPKRQGWQLRIDGHWNRVTSSDDFRQAHRFNRLAIRLGRDLKLPQLSAADGRRALRLMHEIHESEMEKNR